MRIVIQRAVRASVAILAHDDASTAIGQGLLLLVGFQRDDAESTLKWAANKIANLRIFPDDQGKMNLAIGDIPSAAALVVPNFTVGCDVAKGRRPSFDAAMPPDRAAPMFDRFVQLLSDAGIPVATGVFGAQMMVSVCNDGPVTFVLES